MTIHVGLNPFVSAAVSFGSWMAPWAVMWTLAFAIFAVCKWQTFRRALEGGLHRNSPRALAYLIAWPGMDAQAFLSGGTKPPAVDGREWGAALAKTATGAALLWGVVRVVPETQPLLAGWIGMLGLVLLLHFGSFHVLSLVWRSAGIDAQPIMRRPLEAHSLSDFWGRRWNLGFRQLTHDLVFHPCAASLGVPVATMLAFLASGLIHELVISVPSRGGYGLPTAYFLLQGLCVVAERSSLGRSLRFRHGLGGRVFLFCCAAGPVYWLFHPPFVMRVIMPFLGVVGAR